MRKLYLYAPALKKYETDYLNSENGWRMVSVTGTACAFNCDHCNRRILEGMEDASTREKMKNVLEKVIKEGHRGLILSGGSSVRGEVPIWRYSDLLSNYANKLTFIAHTGVVRNPEIAEKFAKAGVKIALLDMVGDNETIRDVLKQPFTVDDYLNSFKYLKSAGIKIAPHVIVGLSRKGIDGDLHAIELLKEVNPDTVIIVGLMPLVGTRNTRQPTPQELIAALRKARDEFSVPVMLGCARPRGSAYLEVDKFAVDYDIDGIAFPEEEVIPYARNKREIIFSNACCGNVIFDVLGVI
ncbi:radical SAM protein [Sulfurisphaera tokodaii]|uniref:Radical SAM core domain-containing protein n=2 Tax=Sulfurisphaera tokodaii TaxID=111955 RepID=Q96ZE6_SULTO|nr:radical SAM protein [Sulfurisphaera tokodaii]BAB66979.1 hypothetical protein STK_18870 [Sulfurisphaera tokodaii str. 7]HII75366.1 radical SAM protein [Sulfurisphaera tokodaii]